MEKQVNIEKFITMERQPSLGILGILWEALKTTARNRKVLIAIFLLVSLSFSLVAYVSNHVFNLVIDDMSSQVSVLFEHPHDADPTVLSQSTRDLGLLLVILLVVLVNSCIILLFFSASAVSSSSEAYIAKVLNLKDMFSNIKEKWEGTIVISFYMVIISWSFTSLSLTLIALMASDGIFGLVVTVVFAILAAVHFHTVAVVWMLSVVVSIVENESSGLKSIARAGELMKGKRLQAYVMMLPLLVASAAVFTASNAMTLEFDRVPWMLAMILSQCAVMLFMFVLYTVFYHECKKSRKEAGLEGLQGVYVPLASDEA